MMNYGKTKDSQMKFDALIDKIEVIGIDCLISLNSLVSNVGGPG